MKKYYIDLELFRMKDGPLMSTEIQGLMGAFRIPTTDPKRQLIAISSGVDELTGWEHVSAHTIEKVTAKRRKTVTPTWAEMCLVKSIFWEPQECVIQFHPSKSEYINCHENTLHLWKAIDKDFPIPNKALVGV